MFGSLHLSAGVCALIVCFCFVNGEYLPDAGGQREMGDNRTDLKFAPSFKNPAKMYNLDYKPTGSSIRLRCAARGNPAPNITWFKNGGLSIPGATYRKWALILEELTCNDAGNYTCVVCNELGCIQHTVSLYVQERFPAKPYIREGYPGNWTVLVNHEATLSCPPVSDLEPFLYWTRISNSVIGEESGGHVGYSIIKSQNPSDKPEQLTIYNVTKEDEGWYACTATNSLGNTTAKGYLSVLEQQKVAITISPLEALRKVGDDLVVLCKVPYEIDACRITIGNTTYRLSPSIQHGDVVYSGSGLKSGECGALIRRVRAEWDGHITCNLPPQSGSIEVSVTMKLTVARL